MEFRSLILGTLLLASCSRVIDMGGLEGMGGSLDPTSGSPVVPQWLSGNAISSSTIAVVINDNDPQSTEIGAYYQVKRGVPAANMIHISMTANVDTITAAEFNPIKADVESRLPSGIQAYALTWTRPYRVECMAVTSAFALGYAPGYCTVPGTGCRVTTPVAYYNSQVKKPFDEMGIRPTMMIAGITTEVAKGVIDRGVASDGTFPSGTSYMIRTTDAARSVRWPQFQQLANTWNPITGIAMQYLDNSLGGGSNVISNKSDVLFYFQSSAHVSAIETNTYLPGAVADHVTSFGGQVPTSSQMSAARFLEVGATASYGTVVEPCNYTAKFPNVQVFVPRYYRGETILESYWKSVNWPGEGLFIGEPLARPFGTKIIDTNDQGVTVDTTELTPNTNYLIESADSEAGPFSDTGVTARITQMQKTRIEIPGAPRAYYRFKTVP